MIRRLDIKNLRAIGPEGISLKPRPLTVLVGGNGSGKTSVLEAVPLVAQSVWNGSRIGINPDGGFVPVSDLNDLFHRRDGRLPLSIRLDVDVSTLDLPSPTTAWLSEIRVETVGYSLAVGKSVNERYPDSYQQAIYAGAKEVAVVTRGAQADGPSVSQQLRFPSLSVEDSGGDPDHVLAQSTFHPRASGDDTLRQVVAHVRNIVVGLAGWLSNRVILLASLRGAELFKSEAGPAPLRSGRHGEDTIRLLQILQASPAQDEALNRLRYWAAEFGMMKVAAGSPGEAALTLRFLDPTTKTELPIRLAGSGSQKMVSLLTDIFATPSQKVIFVDELDAATHPEWQLKLPLLLAEAIDRGHQIFLSTHSPTAVLAVCAAVNRKALSHQDVVLYSIRRDPVMVVAEHEISASGSIEGGWLDEFGKVERELMRSWLNGEETKEGDVATKTASKRRPRGGGHKPVHQRIGKAGPDRTGSAKGPRSGR